MGYAHYTRAERGYLMAEEKKTYTKYVLLFDDLLMHDFSGCVTFASKKEADRFIETLREHYGKRVGFHLVRQIENKVDLYV